MVIAMKSTTEKPIVFLKGKRVTLRPVLESDIPNFLRWVNEPEVSKFLIRAFPVMEASEKDWVKNLSKRDDNIVFVIIVDGIPIGTMGVHRIDWRSRTATTGAMIGEKEFWGKGYGTESKMLVLDYLFNTLNLRKICSSVIEFNGRSQRYSEKCGYRVEGTRKAHFFAEGRYWDEIQLAVFREDWIKLWEDTKDQFLPSPDA